MRRFRSASLWIQDVFRQALILAIVFAVLSPFSAVGCWAQIREGPDTKAEEEPPPDNPPPDPPQPVPASAHLDIYGFIMLDNGYNAG